MSCNKMVEGSPPSGNSVSPAPTHQKPFIYNTLRASGCRSPRPYAGNVFLHIFPKQRMDVGSIPTAIKCGVVITQVSSPRLSLLQCKLLSSFPCFSLCLTVKTEILVKSLETVIILKHSLDRFDCIKTLLEIAWRPLCIVADNLVQESQCVLWIACA